MLSESANECIKCPAGMLAPSSASVGIDSCTVPTADDLALFTRTMSNSMNTLALEETKSDLASCAQRYDQRTHPFPGLDVSNLMFMCEYPDYAIS